MQKENLNEETIRRHLLVFKPLMRLDSFRAIECIEGKLAYQLLKLKQQLYALKRYADSSKESQSLTRFLAAEALYKALSTLYVDYLKNGGGHELFDSLLKDYQKLLHENKYQILYSHRNPFWRGCQNLLEASSSCLGLSATLGHSFFKKTHTATIISTIQQCEADNKSFKRNEINPIEPFTPPYYAVAPGSFIHVFDKICSRVEWRLGFAAIIPILGTIPALIRVALGAVQFTLALASSATSLFLSFSKIGRDILLHSLRHIVHGLANILAGVLEAIPLVGSLIAGCRELSMIAPSGPTHYISEERGKFLGYSTVRYHDWKETSGLCDEDIPSLEYRDFTTNEPIGKASRLDCFFAI